MRTPAQHAASRANGAPRNAVEQPAVEQTCSAIQSFPDGLKCLLHACGALAGKNPRIQALRQPGETKHVNSNPRMHASAQPPAGPAGGPHCAPEPLSMRLRHRNLFIRVHPWPPPPPGHRTQSQSDHKEISRKPPPSNRPRARRHPRRSLYPCASAIPTCSSVFIRGRLRLRHPTENPGRTHENPGRTQENPPGTRRQPTAALPTQGLPRHFFLVHPSTRLDPSATEGITLTT